MKKNIFVQVSHEGDTIKIAKFTLIFTMQTPLCEKMFLKSCDKKPLENKTYVGIRFK
jgi:hypothetical protein